MSNKGREENVTRVMPYGDSRQKSEQVQEMFDSIAPAYDIMNTAMTLGLHNVWRTKALDAVSKGLDHDADMDILDIATGTGDVAFELHDRFPKSHITGIDLSAGMLAVARRKLENMDDDTWRRMDFSLGDSLNLEFWDNSFDLVTVAYGVRNFQELERGLKEMHRVLKPGGRLCVIELSEPQGRVTKSLYRLYARHLIPLLGRLVSRDARAYSYLPESIAAAPQRDRMTDLMSNAGFAQCRWKSLTFGTVTYYIAVK